MQLSPLQSLNNYKLLQVVAPRHAYSRGSGPAGYVFESPPVLEIASSGVIIISTETSLAPTGTSPVASNCSLRASATAKKNNGVVWMRSSEPRTTWP